jgi:putative transposase
LTLVDLGLGDGLRRTLKSTNPIENLNATMERSCSRVCRWKNASMARRWAVSAALEAESASEESEATRRCLSSWPP